MAGSQVPFIWDQSVRGNISSKQWAIAATLAFTGALNPLPVPLTGLHKVYLGQFIWGGVYLLLGWTQIPRVACVIEGICYLVCYQQAGGFGLPRAKSSLQEGISAAQQTQAIATALRELEKLRQDGLISEHEFEQNRRTLLAKLS